MLGTGTVTIGWLSLYEEDVADTGQDDNGYETVSLTSFSTHPQYTHAQMKLHREEIGLLKGLYVPVAFTNHSDLNGFYYVTDASCTYENWDDTIGRIDYTLSLARFGPENTVDMESILFGAARQNDFTNVGEKWHAPAVGATGYYTGTTKPTPLTRVGQDGNVTLMRGVPANVNPKWHSTVANYLKGAARITYNGITRMGTNIILGTTGWTVENSLVRIAPGATGLFSISHWDGGAWVTTDWNVSIGGTGAPHLTSFDAATIVMNEPHTCTIRLMKSASPGRTTLDITVRRGSRFVECYLRTDTSTTCSIWLQASQTLTDSTASGYVVATGDDANGNRVTAGTAKSCIYNVDLGFYKAAVTAFDFYIGLVLDGGAAAAGDAAADLMNQYIGTMSESVNFTSW